MTDKAHHLEINMHQHLMQRDVVVFNLPSAVSQDVEEKLKMLSGHTLLAVSLNANVRAMLSPIIADMKFETAAAQHEALPPSYGQ